MSVRYVATKSEQRFRVDEEGRSIPVPSEPYIVDKNGHRLPNPAPHVGGSAPARKKSAMSKLDDAALIDVLGSIIAELRAEWHRDLEALRNETRATNAEFKAAMLEALLAKSEPVSSRDEAVERLRAIDGGRR